MTISEEMLYENAPKAREIWLGTLPQKADVPEHAFSEQFEKKMDKLLRRPKRIVHLKTFWRAVAAVMIIATIMFSSLMTVSATFREQVIETVIHVFNELTEYKFVSREPIQDTYEISEVMKTEFGYVPEKFIEKERETGENYEHIRYENDDGKFFVLDCELILQGDSVQVILDTERSKYEKFYMGEKEAYLNIKNGIGVILWTDDNAVYHLRSNLPLEELKKIALKIK